MKFGGDIDVDSASWTGPTSGTFAGASATLATNRTLAKDASETYAVTVLATVDSAAWDANATLKCQAGDNPSAGGFLNTALLTANGIERPADDCSEPSLPTITKTATGAVQQSDDASKWLVSYLVTVTSGGLDTFYDLSDSPDFAPGISLGEGTAQRTDIADQPVVDITSGVVFANDVALPAGATHTYRVTWLADLEDNYDPEESASCGATPSADHGFYNRAVLTVGGVVRDGEACIPVTERVYPTVTKTASATAQNADGTWSISYQIEVALSDDEAVNPNGIAAEYDLADTLSFGGGITVDSASWTGPTSGPFTGNSATLATDRTILAGATHTYTVSVVARITPAAVEDETLTCQAGTAPEAGGFLNTAQLHSGDQDSDAHACTEPASPTVTKSALPAVQNPATGEWTLAYHVVVTNPSSLQLAYTLDDNAAVLPLGVTGGSWSASGPTESTGSAALNPAWIGTGRLATGVLPATAGSTHTYTVTRTVRVAASVAPDVLVCGESADSGGGFWNSTEVTNGAGTDDDDACITIERPGVDVAKTVTDTRQLLNGQWQITYEVVATNQSSTLVAVYSLADTLKFGGDIDVDQASWTGPTNGTFTGTSATFATDRAIAGGASDTYTVTVLATIEAEAWTAEESTLQCRPSANGSAAGGFLNTSVLTANGDTKPAEDCSEPTLPKITKSASGAAVQDPSDASKWTVSYDITVDNAAGLATFYDLADTPGFASGITLGAGTAQRTDIDGQPVVPITSGVAFVTGAPLGARETHSYRVTWAADLTEGFQSEAGTCGEAPSQGQGFFNSATLSVGGVEVDDDACVPVPEPVHPSVTKTDTSTAQGADGNWTISYQIVVNLPANQANQAAEYSLDDTLAFGGGVTVVSASWTGQSSGAFVGTSANLADRATIASGATHSYTVTAIASITPAAVAGETLTCRTGEGGPLAGGFLNTVLLTSRDQSSEAHACTEPAAPKVTKTAAPAVQNPLSGEWTLTYQVVVTNPASIQLAYNLDDTAAALPAGVTGGKWTASGPSESTGSASLVPGWNGSGRVANGVLPAGTSHTFTVTRTVSVAASVSQSQLTCGPTSAQGGGFWNSTAVTNGVGTDADDACVTIDLAAVSVAKTVTSTTEQSDGSWKIAYNVVVTNASATTAAVYSLTDTLAFGSGIVVDSASWTGPEASWGAFTGGSATLATEAVLSPGGMHTFTVTALATVPTAAFDQGTAKCLVTAQGPQAGGFLNTALLKASGAESKVWACSEPTPSAVDDLDDSEDDGDTAVLAMTGATALGAGVVGLGLFGLGVLAVLFTRRRRSEA